MDQIERIQEMERCLNVSRQAVDKLTEAIDEYEMVLKDLRKLNDYYGSTRWMKDYDADEEGKLPADLKRGVLSEDAVFDLLVDNHDLAVRILKDMSKVLESQLI